MGSDAESVLAAALALNQAERTTVVARLLESLHDGHEGQASVDDGWREELGNRVDDVLHGHVELIPWEQTQAKGRALLDQLRK